MRTLLVFILSLFVLSGSQTAMAQSAPAPAGRLADLVAALERANPEVAAAQREIDMRAARVKPAGAPPDPIVSAGFMGGFRASTACSIAARVSCAGIARRFSR
jgi:outer membrane protein TolC